jgi:hypothetical protein
MLLELLGQIINKSCYSQLGTKVSHLSNMFLVDLLVLIVGATWLLFSGDCLASGQHVPSIGHLHPFLTATTQESSPAGLYRSSSPPAFRNEYVPQIYVRIIAI